MTKPLYQGDIEILRDDYGVPHIYASALEGACYAHGYAQAEDRIEDIMKNFLRAEGRLAEFFGNPFVVDDIAVQHHLDARKVDEAFSALDKEVLRCLEAFCGGIQRAVDDGVASLPSYGECPTAYRALRLAMWMSTWWSFMHSEEGRKAETAVSHYRPIGSSGVIIGKSRTRDGSVLATIDPHTNYWETWNWYEVHLHAPGLDVFGYTLCGIPFVMIGHTERISWTATMGSSDCCTLYELKVDPSNSGCYRFDGESRPFSRRTLILRVKTDHGIKEVEKQVLETVHGPVLRIAKDSGVAVHYPLRGDSGLLSQLLAMNRAKDVKQVEQALRRLSFFNVCLYVAGSDGTIWTMTCARAPLRPRQRKAAEFIPGWRSDMLIRGCVPFEDLPRVFNPPEDFVENRDCQLDLVAYAGAVPLPVEEGALPDHVTNERYCGSGWSRIRRLILSYSKMGPEELMAIYTDLKTIEMGPWQEVIRDAWSCHGDQGNADARKIMHQVTQWDGVADRKSIGASAMRVWAHCYAEALSKDLSVSTFSHYYAKQIDSMPERVVLSIPKSAHEREVAARAIEEAAAFLKRHYGRLEVPFGELQRFKRGKVDLPVEGFCVEGMPSTPRVLLSRAHDDGRFYAWAGNAATTIVQLGTETRSWAHRPLGQSENPKSPHYSDQLGPFCEQRFRPTWFLRGDLEGHITSRKLFQSPLKA